MRYYLMADYEQQRLAVYELKDNTNHGVRHIIFLLEPGCEITLNAEALWR